MDLQAGIEKKKSFFLLFFFPLYSFFLETFKIIHFMAGKEQKQDLDAKH